MAGFRKPKPVLANCFEQTAFSHGWNTDETRLGNSRRGSGGEAAGNRSWEPRQNAEDAKELCPEAQRLSRVRRRTTQGKRIHPPLLPKRDGAQPFCRYRHRLEVLIFAAKRTVFPPGGTPGSTAGRMPTSTRGWRPQVPRSGDRDRFPATLGGLTLAYEYGFCCLCTICRQRIYIT